MDEEQIKTLKCLTWEVEFIGVSEHTLENKLGGNVKGPDSG